jgi:hypothetical protein
MSGSDEDDKKTVILDLNALKKQKLQQEEDLANLASELEFNVGQTPPESSSTPRPRTSDDSELHAEQFLLEREKSLSQPKSFPVVLFDFQSDFFAKSKDVFPKGFEYQIITNLQDLNNILRKGKFQLVVFNYDVVPKAVNQLCSQIKAKFPHSKTLIMAKSISPRKAEAHAKTASGASGYYQFPLDTKKIEKEFLRIYSDIKKVS